MTVKYFIGGASLPLRFFKKPLPAKLCFMALLGFQFLMPKAFGQAPAPAFVAGVSSPVASLNGKWDFRLSTESQSSEINVPGEWEMQGFRVDEGETAVYSRRLELPEDWQGHRVKLRFEGVSSHAVIKVNGQKITEHEGSFVPFEADITNALKKGDNLLEVEVQSLTISDRLACTSQYAVHTVGGILRDVWALALPKTYVSGMIITTEFDPAFKDATLQINASLENASPTSALTYTLRDASGKAVASQTAAPYKGGPVSISVKQPRQWNPESPYLYELSAELKDGSKTTETLKEKVGFRQIHVQDGRLLVNGKPVKLHGVNRHYVHPITGRSISKALDVQDALLFREANCNYIRTSHYPPTEAFLKACDSLGLFVEDESSLCWIEHGASPIWKKWNYKDPKFLPYMMQANLEKVKAARNHPSVILWSLGNESRWSPLWEEVNKAVKALDPTRPTVFHDQCWGGFNNAHSKADIANYHYPDINGAKATDTMSRPVLFGEFAHISTYNRREVISDPGIRSRYGAPLAKMYDSMYHHDKCLGGAIWSGIDDEFHMPDGRIVGYGPWGIIDAWRRKKPEFFGVKKAYSPIRITQVDRGKQGKGYLTLSLENRYDFTSLKDIKIIALSDGASLKTLTADIPPHGKGTLKVPFSKQAKQLMVRFIDPRGFVANEETYDLQPAPVPVLPESLAGPAPELTENEASISVRQGDLHYLISKSTGLITSVKRGGKPLLLQGPVFAVIPMNSDDGGKPNVAGETYQNNIYPIKGYPLYDIFATAVQPQKTKDGVEVNAQITFYDGSKGAVTYTFKPGGLLSVDYAIEYKGTHEHPYQYGMLMQLPLSMNKLTWKRQSDFSGYPADDISAESGVAFLNDKPLFEVSAWRVVPQGAWKDDASAIGSNGFISTKANIYQAALADSSGQAVTAYGQGKQSSRAWLQDKRIQWLIADYTNNGSEPFYGTPFTEGREKIKDKTLKGALRLSF